MNARRRKIHVLDSYGTLFGRRDLENTVSFCHLRYFYFFCKLHILINQYMYKQLKGLRMQMEYTLQCTGLKDHAWPDVNVDTWDVVEVMVDRIQFDGYV